MMKAIGYRTAGPITAGGPLVAFDAPVPTPGLQDVVVRVRAVSVNPVDTKLRQNASPVEGQTRILGFDGAGEITAVGPAVTGFAVGDEVYYAGSINRPGSNAEFQAVDARIVARKPRSLDFAKAAALPLTTITAWELLFDRLAVPFGQKSKRGSLLIIGAAGGVGSILIQLARRLTGLTVIATASRAETADWCRALGADLVIDHRQPLQEGLRSCGLSEVDYVASLTNTADHLPAIVELIKPQGKLALIDDPAHLDILPFKRKAVSVHWEFMFTRPVFVTDDIAEQGRLLADVAALIDAGVLRTTWTQTVGRIDVAGLSDAHRRIESGQAIGKTVLEGF